MAKGHKHVKKPQTEIRKNAGMCMLAVPVAQY